MEYYKNLDLQDIVYFCEFDLIEKTEQWGDVPSYENEYSVSDLGRIKSLKFGKQRLLKGARRGGYLFFNLHKKGKSKIYYMHQLVAIVFLKHVPCGHQKVVNHKDFNIFNNMLTNLEIVTQRENGNKKHLKSSSKFTGVHWSKARNKWTAQINIKGITHSLGRYSTEEESFVAYNKALDRVNNGLEYKESSDKGVLGKGENHRCSKLKEQDVLKIRDMAMCFTKKEISNFYNVNYTTIRNILNRTTWKHVI